MVESKIHKHRLQCTVKCTKNWAEEAKCNC